MISFGKQLLQSPLGLFSWALLRGKLGGLEFSSLLPAAGLEGITDTLTLSCTTALRPELAPPLVRWLGWGWW